MALSIHPNSASLNPTIQDMEFGVEKFVKGLDNESSHHRATTSRPDLVQRSSPPMTSSILQSSVRVKPIIQDMATFERFAKELENISSDRPVIASRPCIRHEAMLHTADLETLAMTFTKLMAMDDPFNAFPRAFVLPLDTWIPTEPCYLFSIPRELRDMITDIAISAGDISILQTSKQLYGEGIGLLYKRRICHINLNVTKRVPRFDLAKPIAALIQNVTVKIFLGGRTSLRRWGRELEPIRKFSGLRVPRQTCRVVLLFDNYSDYWTLPMFAHVRLPTQILEALWTLIGFARVLIELHDLAQPSACEQYVLGFWRMEQAKNVHEGWSWGLGPCVWHETVGLDGGYLEFHPREHWEANPGALPANVQRLIDRWAMNE